MARHSNIDTLITNNFDTVYNILCVASYAVTGAAFFGGIGGVGGVGGFGGVGGLSGLRFWGAIISILFSVVFGLGFLLLQKYLYLFLLPFNRKGSKTEHKHNALMTNVVTGGLMSAYSLLMYPFAYPSFTTTPLLLCIVVKTLHLAESLTSEYIELIPGEVVPDRYSTYHIDLPLTISIAASCIWTSNTWTIVLCGLTMIDALAQAATEAYYEDRESKLLAPIVRTHHLLWSYYNASNIVAISSRVGASLWITMFGALTVLRTAYVRARSSDPKRPVVSDRTIREIRSRYGVFHSTCAEYIELSKSTSNKLVHLMSDFIKHIVSRPSYVLYDNAMKALIAKEDDYRYYVRVLDSMVLFFSILPLAAYDRYYLGLLCMLFSFCDTDLDVLTVPTVSTVPTNHASSEKRSSSDRLGGGLNDRLNELSKVVNNPRHVVQIGELGELSEHVVISCDTDVSTVITTHMRESKPTNRVRKW